MARVRPPFPSSSRAKPPTATRTTAARGWRRTIPRALHPTHSTPTRPQCWMAKRQRPAKKSGDQRTTATATAWSRQTERPRHKSRWSGGSAWSGPRQDAAPELKHQEVEQERDQAGPQEERVENVGLRLLLRGGHRVAEAAWVDHNLDGDRHHERNARSEAKARSDAREGGRDGDPAQALASREFKRAPEVDAARFDIA